MRTCSQSKPRRPWRAGYAEADITRMQALWGELQALEFRLETAAP